jgi:hypothetical protein
MSDDAETYLAWVWRMIKNAPDQYYYWPAKDEPPMLRSLARAQGLDPDAHDRARIEEARELEQMLDLDHLDRTHAPPEAYIVRAGVLALLDDPSLSPAAFEQVLTDAALLHPKEAPVEQPRKPTGRDVIERYNRAHARNPKITLKQVCAEMNVNYASIRALKSRYAKQKRPKRKS